MNADVFARLRQSIIRLAIAGFALTVALVICHGPVVRGLAGWDGPRDLAALAILAAIALVVYGGIVLMLFGSDWIAAFRGKRSR